MKVLITDDKGGTLEFFELDVEASANNDVATEIRRAAAAHGDLTDIDPAPWENPNAVERCPYCHVGWLQIGYGLVGGGVGPYHYCDTCDYFSKTFDEVDEG